MNYLSVSRFGGKLLHRRGRHIEIDREVFQIHVSIYPSQLRTVGFAS